MKKDQNTLELSRVGRLQNTLSANLPGWQLCPGISGSFRLEWVAALLWNQWQAWRGIRTPGGESWSRTDQQVLARLIEALALVDVRVPDYFLVGDETGVYSFHEHGRL